MFYPKVLFFLGLFSSCLISCSQKERDKDTLSVLLDSRPPTLDPRKATDANGMRLASLIFHSLVQPDGKGGAQADSALKWKLKNLT